MLRPEPLVLRPVPAASRAVAGSGDASLDEERREILASVLCALSSNQADPDEMAACSHLLKHLARAAATAP